ncbi:MAG: phosphogluconate dehydratase [Alphaproteobacteria bacterium]
MNLDPRIKDITDRIIKRSVPTRAAYLARIDQAISEGPQRGALSCGNLAHGAAACGSEDKHTLATTDAANIGIISAYNDMLSAHQPLQDYPALIKQAAHDAGGVAQFAGGVPAMCDGVTQGQPGMDLSLMSRDIIAQSAAIGLSHNMFDAAIMLGVCDKIVPGLVIAALSFGHLPVIFMPAGPMPSGLTNKEKAAVREAYAAGNATRDELLAAEQASYHSAGTCTFYGTANTNQMLMEVMGLHLPGSSFVAPGTQLREALVKFAATQALTLTHAGNSYTPVGHMLDERAFVNGMVGLHATGGSTNLTIHLIAMARAAGIIIDWDDMSALSDCVPLLARVYPNGLADVNHFAAAGGIPFIIRTLLDAGLMHEDVKTLMGDGLHHQCKEPALQNGALVWRDGASQSGDRDVARPANDPFAPTGGLKLLSGSLGRAIIKASAVGADHQIIEAPAKVFASQDAVQQAFAAGELHQDVIVVLRFQGPRANGMPELHKLTPPLGVLQSLGYKVALVTDGRMSGASGKVPAAIHLVPEACDNGPIGQIEDGDIIRLDATTGTLTCLSDLSNRPHAIHDPSDAHEGMGRDLFGAARHMIGPADKGGSILWEHVND